MKKLAVLMILLFSLTVFAANEIQFAYEEGSTLYFRVREADGDIWNTSGTPAFENWADGNVTDYDIALTDEEGAHYQGAFPACSAGIYTVSAYLRAGANPAVADLLVGTVDFVWDGSNEITLSMLDTNIDDIETDTAAVDTTAEMRTFLTGSDTTVATQAKQDIITTDTNELQTDWTNAGRLDTIIDSILTDTGTTLDDFLDTEIAAILADSNELQTDWTNTGRLDTIIDSILTDTGTTLDDFLDTEIAAILADSNELQTDWVDGGRLDLIIDAILADSNDTQEDWATVVAQVADVNADTDTLIVDVNDVETTVEDIQSTSGAGGFSP